MKVYGSLMVTVYFEIEKSVFERFWNTPHKHDFGIRKNRKRISIAVYLSCTAVKAKKFGGEGESAFKLHWTLTATKLNSAII